MKATEHELRDYFLENPEALAKLLGEYWQPPYLFEREVTVGSYGRIDLLWLDIEPAEYSHNNKPTLYIKIFELKEGSIDHNAVGQICRYKRAIERARESVELSYNLNISGYLIGKNYSNGDVCYVADNIEWLSVYFYDLNFSNGLSLRWRNGWSFTNVADLLERHYNIRKRHDARIEAQQKFVEHFTGESDG